MGIKRKEFYDQIQNGFSPQQLVFGKNPNLQSVFNNKIPAQQGISDSENVVKHIASLNSARNAFNNCETSAKIRKALAKQTRNYDTNFEHGEKVHYKRDGNKRWRGPGVVIGQKIPLFSSGMAVNVCEFIYAKFSAV